MIETNDIVTLANDAESVNKRIDSLQAAMELLPEVECPLIHTFTPGLYTRSILMPPDTLIVSKIHKTRHPFIVSKGVAFVKVNGEGWQKIEAPFVGVTEPGTRRILYIKEATIWSTCHVLAKEGETVEEIEERIIEKREIPKLVNHED
jgi:hypothetical protein